MISPGSFISSSAVELSVFSCSAEAHGSACWSNRSLLWSAQFMCWYCIGTTWSDAKNSFSKSWWCSSFKISFTEKGVEVVELGCISTHSSWIRFLRAAQAGRFSAEWGSEDLDHSEKLLKSKVEIYLSLLSRSLANSQLPLLLTLHRDTSRRRLPNRICVRGSNQCASLRKGTVTYKARSLWHF